MTRLTFLDWTRGIAVLLMIQCHAFNSFTRTELRHDSGYVFSQFFGGMAAPLFLLLAGVTFAFQFEKLDRLSLPAPARLKTLVKRGGYILMIAYAFRLFNAFSKITNPDWSGIWKVDVLNCMGAGMIVLSLITLVPSRVRAQTALITGLALAAASPIVSNLDWSGVLPQIKEYFVPNRARFPLFPWTAYIAFGIAAGVVLRRTKGENLSRTLQWGALLGFGMVFGAQYFSNLPFTLYDKVDFWTDSPMLVLIRTGLCLLTLAFGYVWTEYLVRPRAGWVQVFGQTSLLVYWVHIVIVYGMMSETWGGKLEIWQSAVATAFITVLMVGLSYARLWQKGRSRAKITTAAPLPVPSPPADPEIS